MKKLVLVLTFSVLSFVSYGQFLKPIFFIKEANMSLKMPNDSWKLIDHQEGKHAQYTFKREAIKDNNGLDIIPAIMIYVEDARDCKQNIITFSTQKEQPFIENGVKIDKLLTWNDKNYPLAYSNSIFYKCHYSENNLEHIFYMIHIINKQNKGIQIYMDMTKNVSKNYINEFIAVIKSIKEQ